MAGEAILYFDGVCGLCNRFVDWLVRRNADGRLRFAPLQGVTASARLPMAYVTGIATVVLEHGGRFSDRSTAAIEAVALLGGPWRLFLALKATPRPLRDAVYDWAARHRYAWFGHRDSCRIPAEGERGHFLS